MPRMPSNSPRRSVVAEQMVVEEVQVPAGEAVDLRESRVDRLRVERAAAP